MHSRDHIASKARPTALVFAAAVFLAGCETFNLKGEPTIVAPQAALEADVAPPPDWIVPAPDALPTTDWVRAFPDPILQDLIVITAICILQYYCK